MQHPSRARPQARALAKQTCVQSRHGSSHLPRPARNPRPRPGRPRPAGEHQQPAEGLRAVAAPIRGAADVGTAAINVSAHAARVSIASLRGDILPALPGTVRAIEAGLQAQGGT